MTSEKWGQLRQRLLKTIGQNNYKTWIEPLEFRAANDGIATFDVPTNFMGNYVSQNFADLILHELKAEDPEICRLNFAVPANGSARAAANSTAAADPTKPSVAAKPAANSTLNTAPLDKRFTFDNFVVGKPNELAHAAARRVAEGHHHLVQHHLVEHLESRRREPVGDLLRILEGLSDRQAALSNNLPLP